MSHWTEDDIPDLTGRRAVITGANSGLGLAAARALVAKGASVVLACRDLAKGERALADVRAAAARGARVDLAGLDLADLSSVSGFADWYAARHPEGLDVLLNNAGVMAPPRGVTTDGFELQLGTNHLGHFALTGLLLPSLLDRPGARVVTVSSGLHKVGRIDFDDLEAERRYDRWRRYGQSKLANLMFALELDRRARAAGVGLVSVAAHPGYAATNLQSAGPRRHEALFMRVLNVLLAQSAEMGALPLLHAATAPGLPGGFYIGPDGRSEARGHPRPVEPSARAKDPDIARRLWEESERLTGVVFELPSRAAA
jgi:NAD(P)-dependent dehydrogenase (short-subunit alcohol dehydrogenase family)